VLIFRIEIRVGVANAKRALFPVGRGVWVVVGAAKTAAQSFNKLNLGFGATVPTLA